MSAAIPVDLDGQYRAIREEAGHVRRGRRLIAVAGTEAADFLQGQLTNDIEALVPGGGCYSALLDRKGHMQADMRVLRVGDGEFLVEVEDAAAATVGRHLAMYRIGRDAEVAERDDLCVTSVIGPAAAEAVGAGPLGPEHAHREIDMAGVPCRAVATDCGIDLIGGVDRSPELYAALEAHGAPAVEEAAAEILRVEAGRPRFGAEMSAETMPAEAGITERAVSFTKGCYIGQETVARLHYKGRPNRHLRSLRLEAPAVAGDAIHADGREVGRLGTFALSPALGPIGLAILRREVEPGDRVSVGEGDVGAEVAEPPLLPPA